MRILLTGAEGNLGSAFRRRPGFDIVPVGRNDWPQLAGLLRTGIDAVIHAAWDIRTSPTKEPVAVLDANLGTTARLLEACRDAGIRKLGFVSTSGVYGDSPDTAEDAPYAPVSFNGLAKLLGERLVADFCSEIGIECQVYRVFNTFGGTDRFSILRHLRSAVDRGTPFTLNNGGDAERDFIHVDDVARIVGDLIQRTLPASQVNVGTGRSTRIADIVAAVQEHHPELVLRHQSVREAPSSRANTTRLVSILGQQRFVDVLEFVRADFA